MLTRNQNIRIGRPDAGDGLEDGLHELCRGNELGTSLGLQQAILGGKALGTLQRLAEINLRPQDCQQPLVLPGLLDEIPRPTAHGFDCQLDVGPGGHHNDGD